MTNINRVDKPSVVPDDAAENNAAGYLVLGMCGCAFSGAIIGFGFGLGFVHFSWPGLGH